MKKNAFTFIETLLYTGIITMIMTVLILLAISAIENSSKSTTEQEVYDNARFISERIKYEIRNSAGINSVSSTQISLASFTPANNPTIISLSGSNLTIQQGAGPTTNLNSANTSISGLTFTNYTSSDNKTKNIQIVFTANAAFNSSAKQEFKESVSTEFAAEVSSN